METQKIFKPEKKIIIISDHRETEVSVHFKKLGVVMNQMNLEVGDFICSDRVAIERKTHSDFIRSIIDGRLFQQVENLMKDFDKPIILIEGNSNVEINDNILKGALARLLADGISLINTKNPYDTAKMIYWIAKKEQEEEKRTLQFKVGKKSVDKKRLKELIVASLPGIGPVISKKLLEHFGSIEKIFSANEEELQKVKGMGKKLAKKIKKVIVENY